MYSIKETRRSAGMLMQAVIDAEDGLRDVGEVEQAARLELLRREYGRDELRVVVFGEFSRGKSTLINALLSKVVLPAKALPTTGHVTRIAWGQCEEVRVRLRGDRVETCPLAQLDSFSTLDFNRGAREDVEAIDVLVDHSLLKDGIVFYDTPGVRDAVKAQTERALEAIASADLIVLVLNATQLLTENEQELAVEWMSRSLGKAVVPVVNWMNVVEERDRAEQRCRVDRWSREHFGSVLGSPWFDVNAKGALEYVTEAGPAPGDDFFALRQALAGLAGDRRRRLQTSSRNGQLRADVTDILRSNDEILCRIRQDTGRLKQQREEIRRDLWQRLSRFDAQARLKHEALTTRATAILGDKLDELVNVWLQGEDKEFLEAMADELYQTTLLEGIDEIEKEAEEALRELTGENLRCPDPMTIGEHIILETRLNVGELKATGISDDAVAGTALASGLLGQAIIPIPVVGFMAGLFAGGWLAEKLGQRQPDYAAAYAAKARESWKGSAAEVMRLLQEQFYARTAMLKEQITQRLERSDRIAHGADPLAVELARREAIDAALRRCAELLQNGKGAE